MISSLNLAATTAMLFSPLTSLRHVAGAKKGKRWGEKREGETPPPFSSRIFHYHGCPVLKAQNVDMRHRTEFGGFLACCLYSPPLLKWR